MIKYRCYTPEECVGLVGRMVEDDDCQRYQVRMVAIYSESVVIMLDFVNEDESTRETPVSLLERYRFTDCSPCGMEETSTDV